jgi:hypothetical protein
VCVWVCGMGVGWGDLVVVWIVDSCGGVGGWRLVVCAEVPGAAVVVG